ncbi:MAG: isoprenyl transferase [Akkermansia sp.]
MTPIPPEKMPRHIACIMDGNGRWASQRGLPRRKGHRAGADTVTRCVDTCLNLGIPWLTLYAFSSENWSRPATEVQALMLLLHDFLKKKTSEMMEKNIRLHAIGDLARLPKRTHKLLEKSMERTSGNTAMNLVLALSYGSRMEIVHATQRIARQIQAGTLTPDEITEEQFASQLYTAGMPDPDLLIRTSGENRISNFLLWQISYAEIYVTDKLWPDFSEKDFYDALRDYASRSRRFGAI